MNSMFVVREIARHGYLPSSTTRIHVQELERDGHI
jgi:predicted transcriptional regulator